MSKKLLFVSIAFPPKNDPECVQAGKYAFYLNKNFDWDITIVTSKIPTLFMPYDATLERLSKGTKKIEIPIVESKLINRFSSIVFPKFLSQPDSKFSYYRQWRTVIKKYDKPDIIYSRSFPLSSTLMALKLKEHYNVPWVMHLSDPWVASPLHNMTSDFHIKYEKITFEKADFISFTTAEALRLYEKKYPSFRDKFFLNTNVYESEVKNPNKSDRTNQQVKIVYTGGLANTRNAEVFLRALKVASEKEPKILKTLNVIFAGDMDSKNRKNFESLDRLSNLQHLGILSQEESTNLQSSADLLLVIDSEIKELEKNVFLPSKIIDYAAQNKDILAITEKGSPSDKFIKKYGGFSYSFDEKEKLADFLIALVNNPKLLDQEKVCPNEYTVENQVKILNTKLLSLL